MTKTFEQLRQSIMEGRKDTHGDYLPPEPYGMYKAPKKITVGTEFEHKTKNGYHVVSKVTKANNKTFTISHPKLGDAEFSQKRPPGGGYERVGE